MEQGIARHERPLVFLLIATLVVVCHHFFLVSHFTTNSPLGSDDVSILSNGMRFLLAGSWADKLTHLVTQNAEHRAATEVLVGLLSYSLFGQFDFYFINFFGSFVYFFAAVLIIAALVRSGKEFAYFSIVAFPLLTSATYLECTIWSSCSISQMGSVFTAALTLFFLVRFGWANFIAFQLSMLIAIFTLANGLLLIPLGYVGLFLFRARKERRYTIFFHTLSSLVIIVFYFSNFATYGIESSVLPRLASEPFSSLLMAFKWFFSWQLSWLVLNEDINTAFILGFIYFCALCFVLVRYKSVLLKQFPLPFLMIIFLLLSILVASVQRSYLLPIDMLFQPRYKMHSLTLSVCFICVIIALIKENYISLIKSEAWKAVVIFLGVLSLVFYGYTHQRNTHNLVENYKKETRCIDEWLRIGEAKPCQWHTGNKKIMEDAIEKGFFSIYH